MARELYANNPVTTLNGSITNVASSLVVSSASGFPSGGNFTIIIEGEILLVTAVSGTTFTVSRGQEGTTAFAHSNGVNIYGVLTDGSLRRLAVQSHGGSIVASRRQVNFIDGGNITWTVADDSGNEKVDISATVGDTGYEATLTAPSLGAFTQANFGSGLNIGTATTSGIGVFLRDSNDSSNWGNHCRLMYVSSPSAPWTLVAKVVPFLCGATHMRVGVCFYDSSGHKMADVGIAPGDGGVFISKWTDYNTFSANYISFNAGNSWTQWRWFKLVDDNTNRIIYLSMDGTNWIRVHSIGRTDFMTANAAAFYVDANNNNGTEVFDAGALLLSWSLVSGVH